MKYWIVPSNDHTFRLGDAIAAQGGEADWRTEKFLVGDIVFIYKTRPEQRIRYVMAVVRDGINFDQSFDQERFWTDKDTYYNGITSKYVRLKLIEEYSDDRLSLAQLHEHGFNGDPRSVRECKDPNLLDFLLHSNLQLAGEESAEYAASSCEIDYPEGDEDKYEGALVKVMANKYERNTKARKECVEKKGYRCMVCGLDFVETYGEIGRDFIHVHHVTPISSIGKKYKLNVDTDLVPVCPNCHYMLHRKEPPYSIEELRKIYESINPN